MARDVKNIFDNASRNIVRNFSNAYSITNEEENNEDYRIYSSKKDKTKKRSTRQKIADVLKGRDKDQGSILQAYKEMKQLSEVRKPYLGDKFVRVRSFTPGMARGPGKIEVQDPKTIRKRHNDRVKQFLYDRAMIGRA